MKAQTNTYPIDAPYGNGTIHYFNIIDKGESTEEGWMRYEAEYEIVGDFTVNDTVKTIKTLYRKYSSLEQLQTEIDQIDNLLGFPDGKGTTTYCNIPEPTIITDEEGNATETFWLIPATYDLQELNPEIPLVSIEVLNDGSIVVTDELIQANSLDNLADNVKNYQIEVSREALYDAEMETIETLIGDGNLL